LRLTSHPLQRCGARAVAKLAKVGGPGDVTPEILDEVAETLTADIVRAAVAPDTAGVYDWWKVLFALYPNSPATHAKRKKIPAELRAPIARLFAPDTPGFPERPCTFCGQPAGVLWAKDKLPMFDSVKSVNTLPPGLAGWPVCRGCRIAMWAFPYGAWVTAGAATVLSCADDEVERSFVHGNVDRALRIQHAGFKSMPASASAERVTLAALTEHVNETNIVRGVTLWMFKNDNQEPWLRTTATRGGIPVFLRRMLSDPESRTGWRALEKALTQRDKQGLVTTSGKAEAAKTLFDPADLPGGPPSDRLQRALLRLVRKPEKFPGSTLMAWRALCRLHLEVVHKVDTSQLSPVRDLIADWVTAEKNPRGRFNDYVVAAAKPGALQKLLMRANARLILDTGRAPDISRVTPALFAADISAWRLRGQLYFEVLAELVDRKVPIARKPEPGDENEIDPDEVDFGSSDTDGDTDGWE
jgi:CRISPR-associated protein Cst1